MNNENTVEKANRIESIMIFVFLAVFVLIPIGFTSGILYIKEDPIETKSAFETMCLHDVIPANGGSISEPTGGSYEYTLIARSNGTVEVWKECE